MALIVKKGIVDTEIVSVFVLISHILFQIITSYFYKRKTEYEFPFFTMFLTLWKNTLKRAEYFL
jgi:hypothetical protein